MDDTAQMLRVTMEGMKFTFEATKESVEMMIKFLMALKSSMIKTGELGIGTVKGGIRAGQFLKYNKNEGKTNKANFKLKSGGAGIGYAVDSNSYKYLKSCSKKAGLLYYEMASFKADGKVHIMVPKEGVSNFQAAMELAEKEMAKKKRKQKKSPAEDIAIDHVQETVEDYLKSQGLDQMSIDEVAEKCRQGMTEEQKKEFDAFTAEMGKKFEEKKENEDKQDSKHTEKKADDAAQAVKNNEAAKKGHTQHISEKKEVEVSNHAPTVQSIPASQQQQKPSVRSHKR